METVQHPNIVDAIKLAFGEEGFEEFDSRAIENYNNMLAENGRSAEIIAGSFREISTYDPNHSSNVTIEEFLGIGQDSPKDTPTGAHIITVWWDDEDETAYTINPSTGEVVGWDFAEIDPSAVPDVHKRLLGALSLFADKQLGF